MRERTFLVIEDRTVCPVACILVRWRCPCCNRTFTDYPPFAAPYKRYALAEMAPRALRYVEDDGVSYRRGVLESYLPIFHWPRPHALLGDVEPTLAHSTLYHWVSALGALGVASRHAAAHGSFAPADWKATTAQRRRVLVACRHYCYGGLATLR